MIKFEKITNEEYNRFILAFSDYHYSQSAEHSYHQTLYGNAHYYTLFKNEHPVIIYRTAKIPFLKKYDFMLGSFGPIMTPEQITQEDFDYFITELRKELKQESCVFLQMYPVLLDEGRNDLVKRLIKGNKVLRKAQKKITWLDGTMYLSLSQDLNEIRRKFRKDIKYNLNKVEKNGILKFRISSEPVDIEDFFDLYNSSQERKSFYDNATKFYRELLDRGNAKLFIAEANGEMVSCILGVLFQANNTAITYISASSSTGLKLRASTFVRWEFIKWAKENKYDRVDFFSVDKQHPKVSKFKEAFRPNVLMYMDNAHDLVVEDFAYSMYKGYTTGAKVRRSIPIIKHI